jgi:hypothetical protein
VLGVQELPEVESHGTKMRRRKAGEDSKLWPAEVLEGKKVTEKTEVIVVVVVVVVHMR